MLFTNISDIAVGDAVLAVIIGLLGAFLLHVASKLMKHTTPYHVTLDKVQDVFPGALKNAELVSVIKKGLHKYGYGETSLVATALCCDEVNRPLEVELSRMYEGDHFFSMGGLAGFSFGGVTAFGAMASHIPDNGSCVIVYGPHVGVDSQGRVGTVERRGRQSGGSCCGSAVAASNYVKSVFCGECKASTAPPSDPVDAQQSFVGSMLLPFAERLSVAEDPMVELPYAMFEAQDSLMRKIVDQGCGKVAGNGKIALVGGIQINTPPGLPDYFLPLRFDVLSNKGKLLEQVMELPCRATVNKIATVFPSAMANKDLVDKVSGILSGYGYGKNSLLATALCCDEVNRPLEKDFGSAFGDHFSMGGLAGFAFGGVTAFGAMAAHIPDNGSCVILYGPHVGVNEEGVVGTVDRRGREKGGACCGSGVAAAMYVNSVMQGGVPQPDGPTDAVDAQQHYVGNMLLPYGERLQKAKDTMVELPYALFDAQDELIHKIVAKGCGNVGANGKIALLGGIQINTPGGVSDYFLPLRFDLLNNKAELVADLLWTNRKRAIK